MVSLESIERYARTIGEEFGAERVILFGSYAYGEPDEDSDVDLLVVMNTKERPWRAASAIRRRHRSGFPMDLMVRTPAQVNDRLAMGDCFMEDVIAHGRVLYETKH
jgi:predicted nucleotidyltransferase